MTKTENSVQELPSNLLFYSEGLRAVSEMMALPLSLPLLKLGPRGDGHIVMVIPGFTANDQSTAELRKFLTSMGYDARGWGLGSNEGMRESLFTRAIEMLETLYDVQGRSVTIIGQSLGGIYARELAKLSPHVRQVICLGSPADRRRGNGSRISALYDYMNRDHKSQDDSFLEQSAQAPDVPCSMIYSKLDGIVHWQTCRQAAPDETTENIEVYGSHSGMGFNSSIYYLLTNRLAQKEGEWQAFKSPVWLKGVFPERLH